MAMFAKTSRTSRAAALAAVVAVVFALLGPAASAQTVGDVQRRDRLIADQENLLNAYRCLFGVDTDVVPGGCANPDAVSPGAAPQSPAQRDIDRRDGLIRSQEALLNVYRCRFDVDAEIVPGGCVDGEPAPVAPEPDPDTQRLRWLEQTHPALYRQLEGLAWVRDGLSELEAAALEGLLSIAAADIAGFRSVLSLPWFGDGIDEAEGDLLLKLADLHALSGESAAAVVGMPFFSSVERDDVLALRSLEWLAGARDGRLEAVLEHPSLRDGITDGDTTLVAAAGAVRGASEVRRLLVRNGARIQAVSAATEHTPHLKISVVRTGSQPRQSTIDDIRNAAEFVEGAMNRPLPVDHIIVVVDPAADNDGGANNGFAFGVHPDEERRQTPVGRFSLRSRIVNQTARFWWRGHASWIDEGAANTIEYLYGADAGVAPGYRRIPHRGACEAHSLGMLAEQDAAPGLRAGDGCSSFLGHLLFSDLLAELGREAFSAGLGRLWRLSHETQDDPEGETAGIAQVREAFPDHAAIVEQHWSGAPNAPERRPVDDGIPSLQLVRWDQAPSYDGTFVTFRGTLLGDAVLSRETVDAARASGRNFTFRSDIAGRDPVAILPPPAFGRPAQDSAVLTVASEYELDGRTFSVRFRFPQALGDPSDHMVLVWGYQDQSRSSSFFGLSRDLPLGGARIQAE